MRKYLLIVLILLTVNILYVQAATLPAASTGASYKVNLTWDAPISSPDPVATYAVFRAPGGGTSYGQIGTTPLTPTTYSDTNVVAGNAYNYIVESVDAQGVDSAPSNTATVTLPSSFVPTPFVIGNPTAH